MNEEFQTFRKARPHDSHLAPTRSAFIDELIEHSIRREIQFRKRRIGMSVALVIVALIGLLSVLNNSKHTSHLVKDAPHSILTTTSTNPSGPTSGNVKQVDWVYYVQGLNEYISDHECISRAEMKAWMEATDKRFHSLLSSSISWNSYSSIACLKATADPNRKWQISITE